MWEHLSEFISLIAIFISLFSLITGYKDKKKLAIATLKNTEARTEETETNSMLKRMAWLEEQVELLTNENILLRERLQLAEATIENLEDKLKVYDASC